MSEVKLTNIETKLVNHLINKNGGEVTLQELAPFAKDPTTVKRVTVLKWISDVKKKYREAGQPVPFSVVFTTPTDAKPVVPPEQKLTQIRKTPDGNIMRVNPASPVVPPAHIDFVLDFCTRSVKTKLGSFKLNDSEWNVLKYLHANVGKVISLSELRDKVVFPQFGSKLPPRWFNAIMNQINTIRRQVPGLKTRIMTIKGEETAYLFQ
jgi:hypothetical protein